MVLPVPRDRSYIYIYALPADQTTFVFFLYRDRGITRLFMTLFVTSLVTS
jgi:hypothetical protein